jgi:hypothetical protein
MKHSDVISLGQVMFGKWRKAVCGGSPTTLLEPLSDRRLSHYSHLLLPFSE